MRNEADTCRAYVVPRLTAAGWQQSQHSVVEQYRFTDGRIVVVGAQASRERGRRADYLLRYTRDLPIAVVEAKPEYMHPAHGLQQAKAYAELLDLRFAYATNGHGIVEFDYLTGLERELDAFPTPEDLWSRLSAQSGLPDAAVQALLSPAEQLTSRPLRYYQTIAINRAVQAILAGRQRLLLNLATGTGKTMVAFQICWKLWNARWGRPSGQRRPKVLFLADRLILVDDPKDKDFRPFDDARHKIEGGQAVMSRDIYFATYQSLARDEQRPGLYRAYPPDFFDLIIVDECHRGSASDEGSWREILEYFAPAVQLGMTATPKRADNVDTYAYFGEPLYTYSLRQGIEDGFLAPYRVQRVVTSADALGWRPGPGDSDRYGRPIPDMEYRTPHFDRRLALLARTEAIARHLTAYLRQTDRFAKTIVFCVDQDHALEMRRVLNNLNSDLAARFPDYVARITASEGDDGRALLGRFKDPRSDTPVIVTTSQLLTTGVDVPTCKNVVLVRVINSMTEFKQIIGRGTRVREDEGKLFFTILDYTGSATRLFADPAFDGEPLAEVQEGLDEPAEPAPPAGQPMAERPDVPYLAPRGPAALPRKYYFDGGQVEIVAQVVYELDSAGNRLRVVTLSDYAAGRVRTLTPSAEALRARWADPQGRGELVAQLAQRGVDLAELAGVLGQPEADPLDLLCHLAYHAPLRTRRERAERLRREQSDFLAQYSADARAVLDALLDKYAQHGIDQLVLPDVLKLPPIAQRGNVGEISKLFGGAERLRDAVRELQARLYAA